MKKKVIFIFILIMCLNSVSYANSSRTTITKEINVVIDKKEVMFKNQNPIIENDRVLVPIRAISEELGFDVSWNNITKGIELTKKEGDKTTTVNLKLDETDILIKKANKKAKGIYTPIATYRMIDLDIPARAINGRTIIPVRAISEIFGCEVEWDGKSHKVIIDTNKTNKTEYLDIIHYKDKNKYKITNILLEEELIEAFLESEPYLLDFQDSQIEEAYINGEIIELNTDLERSLKIDKINSSRLKKMIIFLEKNNDFSKGMILTWNEYGQVKAWQAGNLEKIIENMD